MSRPSYQQLQAIADFLTENPGIAKGLVRSAHGKHESKRKWEEVAVTINSLGGALKDGKGWAKYWADKKCALKKTCAQHAQSLRRTGGGPAVSGMPDLTPIDQRLVAVMGGSQFATGDGHVAVDPFPSTSPEAVIEVIVVPTSPAQAAESDKGNTNSPLARERNPGNRKRQRTRAGKMTLDEDRARFTAIEAQRVEAETVSARALSRAVERMGDIATATEGLATAFREGAQAIADGLIRIAAALEQNH